MTQQLDPIEVYGLYMGIKLHFTSKSYDFIKYGKKKISRDAFLKRNDKGVFMRLAKKSEAELIDLLVSNFLYDPKFWAGNLLSKDAEKIRLAYVKHRESLEYRFKQDFLKLVDGLKNPNEIFAIHDGQNPIILNMLYTKEISMETYVILDDILNFSKSFVKLEDDILYPKQKEIIEKYRPFLHYDRDQFKIILKNLLKNSLTLPNK